MSVDLEDIRQLVEKANEQVALDSQGTTLYIPENDHRQKVKKINPKYCQSWDTLEVDYRANRLIEFVARYAHKNDITAPTSKKIKKLLAKALIQGHLTVDYDEVVGVIKDIPDLKYNHDNGYYIDNDDSLIFRVSKISDCPDAKTIVTEDFTEDETSEAPHSAEHPSEHPAEHLAEHPSEHPSEQSIDPPQITKQPIKLPTEHSDSIRKKLVFKKNYV